MGDRSRPAGASRSPLCWARWTPRWAWALPPSAARTACPAALKDWTSRPRWSALPPPSAMPTMCRAPSSRRPTARWSCSRPQYKDGLPEIGQPAGNLQDGGADDRRGQGPGGCHPGLRRRGRSTVQDVRGQPRGLAASSDDRQRGRPLQARPTARVILELAGCFRRSVPGLHHRGLHAGSRQAKSCRSGPRCRKSVGSQAGAGVPLPQARRGRAGTGL